jgi:2-(1,2-epoxy-1,2-dihydrophenyl)acetyl-CoA isomerase
VREVGEVKGEVGTGAYAAIAVEFDGPVGIITLNRPDKLNSFTVDMTRELAEAMRLVSGSAAVRCIVLTGAGRAFCAGADLAVLEDVRARNDLRLGAQLVDGCRAVYTAMRAAPQPVLCALNGVAAGGGANLALACDLRLAGEGAKIGQVFAKIGLHPDWGGTYFLPRLVGTARAMELFLDAELVPAPRLLELGLVNRVVADGALMDEARAWARRIAAAPPLAVRRMKAAVYAGEHASLDAMLTMELEAQLACFESQDAAEGLAAFRAKRTPNFTGR